MANILLGAVSGGSVSASGTCPAAAVTTQAAGSKFFAYVASTVPAGAPTVSVADTFNAAGAWTRIGAQLIDGSNGYIDRFICSSASGGASDILTATATVNTPTQMAVSFVEVLNPGAFDLSNTSGAGPFIQPINSGSISPAGVPATQELLLSFVNAHNSTAPAALTSFVIADAAGGCTCAAATLAVNDIIKISGTFGGTGSITGYVDPSIYHISVTNGTTSFTLTKLDGTALVTVAGTPTGITVTDGVMNEANGFTLLSPSIFESSGMWAALGYKFITVNGTYSASWTIKGAGQNLFSCAVIDSIKGAAPGGGGGTGTGGPPGGKWSWMKRR